MGVSVGLAGCLGDDDDGADEPAGGVALREDDGDEADPSAADAGTEGEVPTWMQTPIEDVRTGEVFTILDRDEPVVLHTFETWCSTCQRQQNDLIDLYDDRGGEITMVDLTIDDNYDPDDLVAYTQDRGFEWHFGIAQPELTSSLVDDFGQQVAVAPQAPVILICTDGADYDLGKGNSGAAVAETIDDTCS